MRRLVHRGGGEDEGTKEIGELKGTKISAVIYPRIRLRTTKSTGSGQEEGLNDECEFGSRKTLGDNGGAERPGLAEKGKLGRGLGHRAGANHHANGKKDQVTSSQCARGERRWAGA